MSQFLLQLYWLWECIHAAASSCLSCFRYSPWINECLIPAVLLLLFLYFIWNTLGFCYFAIHWCGSDLKDNAHTSSFLLFYVFFFTLFHFKGTFYCLPKLNTIKKDTNIFLEMIHINAIQIWALMLHGNVFHV